MKILTENTLLDSRIGTVREYRHGRNVWISSTIYKANNYNLYTQWRRKNLILMKRLNFQLTSDHLPYPSTKKVPITISFRKLYAFFKVNDCI